MNSNNRNRNHNITTQPIPGPSDQANPSASAPSSSAQATPSTTSGWWTDQEIKLLLDYVEANCSLNTASGLNLKKSAFTKAHAMVKTKDAKQCHYKWGNVCIIIINDGFYC